jgi:IclR family transcriptional regulator, pca regulon regulatory protein
MPRKKARSPRVSADGDPLPSAPRLTGPRYSQSLERGLAILMLFTPERPVLGIKDIAEGLGMTPSTTHRYVSTLVGLGYLEQGASRKYRLGLRVSDLGMSVLNSTGLREPTLRPILKELRQRTSLTVTLAVLDGPEIVCVDRARGFRRGQDELDPDRGLGSRFPAYCTAMGKVLLAHLPEHERHELLSQTAVKRQGPNTIMSRSALHAELEGVLQEGFAVEDQEFAGELIAIAAPVPDETGDVIAAIDIAAHTSTITIEELADALHPILIAATDRFSEFLGYREQETARSG